MLSILVKAQGVQTTAGQLKGLDAAGRRASKGMGTAETSAKRSSKTFSLMGSAAKSAGLLVGAAGLAAGVKTAVSEFREAQKVGAQTNAVLKSTGNAAKVTKRHIEDLSGAISKKSGIDDEAIQTGANLLLTFKGIRNETGKGNKIFDQATQVITDMSVSMKQGLKPSAIQVGKALNDPVKGLTALGRVGVTFTEGQKKQVAALVASGDKLAAQKIILRELKSEFAGSAAAQATAGDKLKVSLGNLAEAAGAILVPALDKIAVVMTKAIDQLVKGQGVARFVITAWTTASTVVQTATAAIHGYLSTHQKDLQTAQQAVRNVGTAMTFVWEKVVLPVIRRVLPAIVQTIRGAFSIIQGLVKVLSSVLTGDFRGAWEGVKQVFSGGIQAVLGVLRAATAPLRELASRLGEGLVAGFKSTLNLAHELAEAMRDLIAKAPGYALGVGKAIVRGIINGIRSVAGGIGSAIGNAIKKVDPTGLAEKIGDGLGKASIVPMKGGGSLMGARPSMAPFAAIGAANGLRVSSGLRSGARTSSGNTSYHSTGEAVDLAGSPAGMMKTFKTLRSKFGSRLAELIYTPGGAGIKNGKPNVYTGQVAADHFDHVHVAFDSGMPGVGDGYGKGALQSLWTRAGGPASAANIAAAVALAESGGQSTASNRNSNGTIDRGLWQINSIHGKKSTFNPLANAKAAVSISSGGRNWNPWVAFKSGAYKKFLGGSSKVAGKAGKGGSTLKAIGKPSFGSGAGLGPSEQQIAEINAQADFNAARKAGAAGTGGGDTGEDAGDPNQPLIDAINAMAARIAEQIALESTIRDEQRRFANVSGSNYAALAKAIADVASGQIGGKVGLGFMSPSFPGGGSRY